VEYLHDTSTYLTITSEDFELLTKRINALGTSKTHLIRLIMYLYRTKELTRKELSDYETYIKELPKEKVNKEIIWVSNDLMEVYETKKMYLYSVNQYLSTLLHVGLHDENSRWTISDIKADKKPRTYRIDNDLAEFLVTFSDKYGISQTLLFNYAFQFKLKDYSRNMPKTNSDVKQLYLTQNSYDNLNIKGIRTFDVLDKQIRTLKSCLEKGEPMF
jgi:hypothetical protein